jgi:hypothetical protein
MTVADAAGPVGLGFVLMGLILGGATLWTFPALICVAIGFLLIVLSR